MAFSIQQDDVIEVTIKGKLLEQDALNVFHLCGVVEPAWVAPDPTSTQLLAAIRVNWDTDIIPLLSAEYSYTLVQIGRISGYKMPVPPLPQKPIPLFNAIDESLLAPVLGLGNADCLPSYCAVSGRKKTNTPGKRYRGGIRFAGVPETDADQGTTRDNYLTAVALPLWQAGWVALGLGAFTPNANNDLRMGVFSLRDMQANNPPGVVPVPSDFWAKMSGAPLNAYLGSQVSRKVGHGR